MRREMPHDCRVAVGVSVRVPGNVCLAFLVVAIEYVPQMGEKDAGLRETVGLIQTNTYLDRRAIAAYAMA